MWLCTQTTHTYVTTRVFCLLPPLIDLTKNNHHTGLVKIVNTQYHFAPGAQPSGTDLQHAPIFGSIGYSDGVKIMESNMTPQLFPFQERGSSSHYIRK